jgi:hypothetical protein
MLRRVVTACALVAAAACDASVGVNRHSLYDVMPVPDGRAPNDTPIDAPACGNGRVVYLNFEGVTLTKAAASDATADRASWMNKATGTAPPYRAGDAARDALITDITAGVRAALAPYPIQVVRTRPAAGPYVMIVFGGVATDVGSNYGGAVNELDCDDSEKSDVAWLSDNVGSVQRNVNFAIGAIGFGLGLTATTDTLGCMCGWANGCTPDNTVACRLSASIARDPNATQKCAALASQDEVAAFATGFCQ